MKTLVLCTFHLFNLIFPELSVLFIQQVHLKSQCLLFVTGLNCGHGIKVKGFTALLFLFYPSHLRKFPTYFSITLKYFGGRL